jgi:hypothetical protein
VSLCLASHLLAVTGCSTWQPAEANVSVLLAPSPAASQAQPASAGPGMPGVGSSNTRTGEAHLSRIRVSTADRGLIELRNPRVSNDTLYGEAAKNAPETAVPVADIRYVEVWKASTGRTVLMVCSIVCSLVVVVGGLNLATM